MSVRYGCVEREAPAPETLEGLAWWAEYQRAALLLETLAKDHFPDQAAFDAWIVRQQSINLRAAPSGKEE